jgi:hypothetical protein
MHDFRSMGRPGLDAFLKHHGAAASRELDRVCAQKDAHTSFLYWHTDLGAAVADARRAQRPILSLRLLGRLDEELSCANSRFFRKLLYPHPTINRMLRERFVLHWHSVRPVPRVTLDFGDGRRLVRTLTGNSVHLVLDSHGRPVDALPGLFAREAFAELLAGRRPSWPRQPMPRAIEASRIAPTKHMVEAPLLRNVMSDVDADTRTNLELHARARAALAANPRWTADALTAWIYRELFLMPPEDPALGLDVPDPFAA